MSNAGQAVLTIGGTLVGAYLGSPQLGYAAGSALGSAFFPTQHKVEGPRIDDPKIPGTEPGRPIPWIQGRGRLAPDFAWLSPVRTIATTTTEGGKGGGPEVQNTTYSYEVDVLFLLTDNIGLPNGATAGVSRIWYNKKLVWTNLSVAAQAALTGEDAEDAAFIARANANLAAAAAIELWARMGVYTGEATQLPDPTYEAAVGTDDALAYRNRTTAFLQAVKLGGSPQLGLFEFEVVTKATVFGGGLVACSASSTTTALAYSGDEGHTWSTKTAPGAATKWQVVRYGGSRFLCLDNTNRSCYSVDNGQTWIEGGALPANKTWSRLAYNTAIGRWLAMTNDNSTVAATSDDGGVSWQERVTFSNPAGASQTQLVYNRTENKFVTANAGGVSFYASETGETWLLIETTGGDFRGGASLDIGGVDRTCFVKDTSTPFAKFSDALTTFTLSTTVPPITGWGNLAAGHGLFVCTPRFSGDRVAVSADADNWTFGTMPSASVRVVAPTATGFAAIGTGTALYSGFDGLVWTGTTAPGGGTGWTSIAYVESTSVEPLTETLADVVSRICQRGDGITASQFDVTDIANITEPVESLWLTQVAPARPTLEMLAELYGFSCTVADKIYFPRRWQAAVATIDFADLGAAADGAEMPQPLAFQIGSELELPAITELSFADLLNDYQTDVQPSDRLLTAMGSKQTFSVPMGMSKSAGKRRADQVGFDRLAKLLKTTLFLKGEYARLEPADAVNALDEDGVTHRLFLLDRTDTWPLLTFKACRDDPTVADSDGITDAGFGSAIDVSAPVDTVMELLDIPLLRDADDGPHLLAAAKGAAAPWPGAAVMRSNDDIEYQRVATITESAVIGTGTTTLGNWSGPHVFDESNSVTVDVGDGALASSTRAALIADGTLNALLIGSEVIQFRIATLVATGIYTLSGLLRGMRGTEHAMVDHVAAERCVLLSPTGLRRIDMQANQLGAAKYYKGITFGRLLSSATAEAFTANGVAVKPFSPTTLRAFQDAGTGDITITCRLRSRLSVRGISTLGQSIPLGEDSAAAELDIATVGSPATILRTLTGVITGTSTGRTATFTYTAAQQATDSTTHGSIYYRAYQISETIDRGYPLEKAA
jgi:hypothetical protein